MHFMLEYNRNAYNNILNSSARNINIPVVVLEQMGLLVILEEVVVPHFGKGILLVAKQGLQGV